MINIIGDTLALASLLMLLTAFFRVRNLGRELDGRSVAVHWRILDIYIALFAAGYLGYAVEFWRHRQHWHDLIVIAILFFGALFVWMVSTLALQTVLALRRTALLEQQTITDALTGLYNRRYLDQRIADEHASTRRYRHPLAVLMIDIDHFKRLNDTCGHQAGDQALQFIGRLLLDSIREADIAARYGGEEFVVLAPNTGIPDARELAERIRTRIESHALELTGTGPHHQTVHITASIGVAELAADMTSGEQLIACADQALYQAKQAGRNRTVIHQSASA